MIYDGPAKTAPSSLPPLPRVNRDRTRPDSDVSKVHDQHAPAMLLTRRDRPLRCCCNVRISTDGARLKVQALSMICLAASTIHNTYLIFYTKHTVVLLYCYRYIAILQICFIMCSFKCAFRVQPK